MRHLTCRGGSEATSVAAEYSSTYPVRGRTEPVEHADNLLPRLGPCLKGCRSVVRPAHIQRLMQSRGWTPSFTSTMLEEHMLTSRAVTIATVAGTVLQFAMVIAGHSNASIAQRFDVGGLL